MLFAGARAIKAESGSAGDGGIGDRPLACPSVVAATGTVKIKAERIANANVEQAAAVEQARVAAEQHAAQLAAAQEAARVAAEAEAARGAAQRKAAAEARQQQQLNPGTRRHALGFLI